MNDFPTISRAALANYLKQFDLATSLTDQTECGRMVLAIKRDLQKYGHTIRSAIELHCQDLYQTYPDLLHGPEPFSHTRLNEAVQTQSSETAQTQSSETTSPQEDSSQKPSEYHDPMDKWVIPWTHAMDREIGNRRLLEKDMRHIALMQRKRYQNERAHNHVVWLKDICRREGFAIPKEYWDWWNLLTPEEQEAATR